MDAAGIASISRENGAYYAQLAPERRKAMLKMAAALCFPAPTLRILPAEYFFMVMERKTGIESTRQQRGEQKSET